MRLRFLGVLDRYVLKKWLATFLMSAIGVPTVAVLIDLSERFSKLSVDRHVPLKQILIGQLYLYPQKITILIPAAVLFATVFTLNAMGRHSELTAVQGGGISFYRLIMPMLMLAALTVPLDYELQEIAGWSTTRHDQLHRDSRSASTPRKQQFAFASRSGWTWAFVEMTQDKGQGAASGFVAQAPPDSAGFRWTIQSDSAVWVPATGTWSLRKGTTYLVSDSTVQSFHFAAMRVKPLVETPGELMTDLKKAEEMTVSELKAYIARLDRAGSPKGALGVELQLKYAVPFACLVVALFGAPLAITNARAGAAIGLAIALGTTLTYLTGTQIMKAIGAKEVLPAVAAAWSMDVFFFVVAMVLLARVRS